MIINNGSKEMEREETKVILQAMWLGHSKYPQTF